MRETNEAKKNVQARHAMKALKLQTEIRKISRCHLRSGDYTELGHFTILFAEENKGVYADF